MQSSVEQLEGLARKLTVEIPAERVDLEVEKRLKEIRPRIRIDGFRPGKVPPNVIKQKYGASVRQDVVSEIVEESYREAVGKFVEEEKAELAGTPEIDLASGFKNGEILKYTAVFEIMPEVNVKGMESIAINLPKTEINDKDVDEMIETLQRQQAIFSEVDKTIEENDRVTVDFVGKLDGEAFAGGSGEDVQFEIGVGKMLPDFENGIKGAKAGEEKTFSVRFPEDYGSEELAGKTAEFTVTVKKVEEMQLPDIDFEFVQRFGIQDGNLENFKQAIRDNMSRELENALRRIKRNHMFESILSNNEDQVVPEVSVKNEIQRLAREMNLEKQIPDEAQRKELAEKFFTDQARRNARLSLLMGKLFSESKLTLDEERLKARVDSIASTYEDPEEVKTWYNNDKQARFGLESAILEEQLIDKLYESAAITYEDKSFSEVMAINGQLRD